MENYNFIFTKLQQLEGGGENEELHEVLNYLQAAERSLTTVPIFWKPFVFFLLLPEINL